MRRLGHRFILGLAGFAIVGGCVIDIDDGSDRFVSERRSCALRYPEPVIALGRPTSTRWGDRRLVLFRQTWFETGSPDLPRILPNTAAFVADGAELCAGTYAFFEDPSEGVQPVVPLTASEVAENRARDDGRSVDLAPLSAVEVEGSVAIFYEKSLRGPTIFDVEPLGTGLCVLEEGGRACTRVGTTTVAGDGSTFWPLPGFRFGETVHHPADGFLYVYGCTKPSRLGAGCAVARVRTSSVRDLGAYEYFDVTGAWVASAGSAAPLLEAPSDVLGMRPLEALNALLFFWQSEDRVVARTADAPTGPFHPTALLTTVSDAGFVPSLVHHPAFAEDDSELTVIRSAPGVDGESGWRLTTYSLEDAISTLVED